MGTIEKKRGSVMLFSNLSFQDSFYFLSDGKKIPYRYIKYEGKKNYYVDSGLYLAKGNTDIRLSAIWKSSQKNCQVVFLQANQ